MATTKPKLVTSAASAAVIDRSYRADLTLETLNAKHIDRVLVLFEGNMTIAARRLGINRRSLQRYMRRRERARHVRARAKGGRRG